VLAALCFVRSHHLTRESVEDHLEGDEALDTSFCSANWARTIRDRDRPGHFVRRHLEVCVFSYPAAGLRSGDIAVVGADPYANFFDQPLGPAEVEPLIAGYCPEVDLPSTEGEFRAQIEAKPRRPLSGSDPKLADSMGRYAVITFTYGTNMGPYQMSRDLRGAVSPHEISVADFRVFRSSLQNRRRRL
jgi:hypothetical protein